MYQAQKGKDTLQSRSSLFIEQIRIANGSPKEDQVSPSCLVSELSKVGTNGLTDLPVPHLTAREGIVVRATDYTIPPHTLGMFQLLVSIKLIIMLC